MKKIVLLLVFAILYSCSSIRVYSDFDSSVDFSTYRSFAFLKEGVDQVEISDLDKRRILKAIDTVLVNKGYVKSEQPDLLISIHTQAKEKVYINSSAGWGWGWGWNPWFWGGPQTQTVSTRTEGTLYIDFIDAANNQLVWQGIGKGGIRENLKDRDQRIATFVGEILRHYPPEQ